MMKRDALFRTMMAGLLGAAAMASAGAAFGQATGKPPGEAPATARITMEQAIATAEQQVGGKAVETEMERRRDGASIFKVKVLQGNQTHKVLVDAQTGQVVRSVLDDEDDEDDDDRRDRRVAHDDDDDD
jgi:Peptidase propeptide and YPEB domain